MNELWFDIILADTSTKSIIWQFVNNETFILGRKHQFLTLFHRFLEIFYNSLVTHYSHVNELWFDIILADTSTKSIIWQFVNNETFILGRKHQFLTLFHRFLEIFYNSLVTHYSNVNELWFDIILADTSTKSIIWQFVNNETFILGRKHQFLTLFHRFLEIFYNSLVTHYSNVNELWFDIILADTSIKSIIWQFVNNETFILGRKHQFLTLFHRFLEIFYNFLVAHHSNVKELWLDITLADTSTKSIIWQFVNNETFILGRKHQFLTIFHRFLEIFYNFLVTHHSSVKELWLDITLADTSTKRIIWQFVRNKTFILGKKHQFLTLFHRFLEIFYNFFVTHYSTMNDLWLDITLADTSTNSIIWQFVNNKTFILGRKHQFLTIFHRFLEIFYNSLVTHYSNVNELWFDIILADTSTKSIIWQFVNNETFILGRKHQFLKLFHRSSYDSISH